MLTNNKPRAPKSIGSNVELIILLDTRERDALPFSRSKTASGCLLTGDYSILGLEQLFAVERKSVADAVACCMGANRERFERELHRLRGFRFKRLLIVGTEAEIQGGCYRSNITPQAVMATLGAFEVRYDLPVVFEPTPEAAAGRVERWAHWFVYEVTRTAARLAKAAKEKGQE